MLVTEFKKQVHPSLNIFTTNQSFQNYQYTRVQWRKYQELKIVFVY